MEKDELAQKVRLYLERLNKSPELKKCSYPLDETGLFRVVGALRGGYRGIRMFAIYSCEEEGHRNSMKTIFKGRFIDAIAFAVQQYEFYADFCDPKDPSCSYHGYVEKIDVCEATTKGLLEEIIGSS
ncbi:MAG: hypothetical protein WC852_02290 [Candidatus Nanoarchaeia archaeon]|jgi:hypothetical protein